MVPVAVTVADCTINQDLKALWPFQSVDPEYVALMIKGFESYILENLTKTGTTVESMKFDEFENHPFLMPPLGEQVRILARVDELMALLDRLEAKRQEHETARAAARDSALSALRDAPTPEDVESAWLRIQDQFHELFCTQKDIVSIRQTILQLAIRGRLVPQDCDDEPAKNYLSRLRSEWAKLAKAKRAGNPGPVVKIQESDQPFSVPKLWEWVRFADVFDCRLGKMLDKAKNSGRPYPYLRNANVRWSTFDLSDLLEMKLEDHVDSVSVRSGDLVICEGGEPGRCAVWIGDQPTIIQKALHRARPMGGILPEFFALHLRADAYSGRLSESFTGVTIKHLTGQSLALYPVVLPPLAEQRRIPSKTAEMLTICQQLESCFSGVALMHQAFAAAAVHHLDT